MKKICAILLAAVLLVSLTAVFATTLEAAGSNEATVTVHVAGATADEVINVDVDWKALNFEYTPGGSTWDPATHKYTYKAGTWNQTTIENALTVKNHSNAALKAQLTLGTLDTSKGLTLTGADDAAKALATAVGTDVADAPTLTWNIGITGTPVIDTAKADPSYSLTAVATVTIGK